MDFVHDQLSDGRPFGVLTVVDQWSRLSPLLSPAMSIRGQDVAAALDRVAGHTTLPRSITVDDGAECPSRALEDWTWRHGVRLDFTRPRKPTDNGKIESSQLARAPDPNRVRHQGQDHRAAAPSPSG